MQSVQEHLDAVIDQLEAKENETYEALAKHGFSGFVPHGESSVFDLFGGSKADLAANNYQVCMNQNHGFDHHEQGGINSLLTKLNGLLKVR